ncbi:MAG TPA: ATP-binding protein [Thermoanaerobaculia bacterium]|nr:ATP-binding protein [Thermoanaerobaculia bacterium]
MRHLTRPSDTRPSDEAAQVQGMEAMGRLAGGIAHVFNNLLTAISCEVELALTRMPPDEPARKHLREIERAGDRGAALARSLLAFSGRQVLQPRLVQLNNLLTGLQDRMRHILGDAIELKMTLDPDLHRVQVDAGQLEPAILNLVTNARDVMPQGGRLTLETRNVEPRQGNLNNPLRPTLGHWVELSLSDTGPGMDEGVRKRVFEPFFTTKQGGEVSGLGLSTTYGIITQSGGHIRAESPGQGSRFVVLLPSAEQPADADGPGGVNGKPWETILLVEDEENVRRPLSEILKGRGYNVLEAADGAQALEVSQQHSGPIHLMVTDILMGSMSGVELAEKLSYDRAEMKVLFATGYPAGLAEGSGLDREDAHLIKKPFTGKDLAAKVREMLESAD